jgi:hypothetical protein
MTDDIDDFKNEMEARRIARLRRDWELTRQKSEQLLATPIPRYRRPRPKTPVIEENENEVRQRERERISAELDQQFPDHDDAFSQWEKNMPKPQITEKERRERALGNEPISMSLFNLALARSSDHLRAEFTRQLAEHKYIQSEAIAAALAELVQQERQDSAEELDGAVHELRREIVALTESLAEAQKIIAQMKAVLDSDRARVIEMPAPPLRRAN